MGSLSQGGKKRGGKLKKSIRKNLRAFFFRLSRVSLYFLRANLNFYITADKFVESKKKVGIFYKTELISTICFHTSWRRLVDLYFTSPAEVSFWNGRRRGILLRRKPTIQKLNNKYQNALFSVLEITILALQAATVLSYLNILLFYNTSRSCN